MPDDYERTYDGKPISKTPPFGAAVIIYKLTRNERLYLVLHRAHQGTDYEGDWAWGPPAGARFPGESIDQCAKRELLEETGLELQLTATDLGNEDWPVYVAEAQADCKITLSAEHDRFEWLAAAE